MLFYHGACPTGTPLVRDAMTRIHPSQFIHIEINHKALTSFPHHIIPPFCTHRYGRPLAAAWVSEARGMKRLGGRELYVETSAAKPNMGAQSGRHPERRIDII